MLEIPRQDMIRVCRRKWKYSYHLMEIRSMEGFPRNATTTTITAKAHHITYGSREFSKKLPLKAFDISLAPSDQKV
jgi:hypothetical protein